MIRGNRPVGLLLGSGSPAMGHTGFAPQRHHYPRLATTKHGEIYRQQLQSSCKTGRKFYYIIDLPTDPSHPNRDSTGILTYKRTILSHPEKLTMKPKEDVISDFNHVVNMSASELETWLESNDSTGAGWPKDDGSGESVGHDSGRKIVQILKANPNKEPEMYTDEDVEHMRKVVAYW